MDDVAIFIAMAIDIPAMDICVHLAYSTRSCPSQAIWRSTELLGVAQQRNTLGCEAGGSP